MLQPNRVIVFVRDMKAMASFYTRLVHGIDAQVGDVDEHWHDIGGGTISVSLHAGAKASPAQNVKLCFQSEKREGLIESVQAVGGKFLEEREPAPGVSVIDFEDPEGNEFAIEIFS